MASAISNVRLLGHLKAFRRRSELFKWNFRYTGGFPLVIRHHTMDPQDGKTTVTVLNKDEETLMINSFSTLGFKLNNGLFALGPIAIFPKTVLSWNVESVDDVNEDSLSLFYHLEPKLDIIVVGVGEKGNKLPNSIVKFILSKKLNVEILPTDQACATFNFLNSEGRYVAGALIPPQYISAITDQDYIDAEARKRQLFLAKEEE